MIGVAHLLRTRWGALYQSRAGRRLAFGVSFQAALVAALLAHFAGAGVRGMA